MVGTVVEVLVAEEAAPALLAEALVGLLARPVDAARVQDALVAEATGITSLAPESEEEKDGWLGKICREIRYRNEARFSVFQFFMLHLISRAQQRHVCGFS